jgi:hypothetical protein
VEGLDAAGRGVGAEVGRGVADAKHALAEASPPKASQRFCRAYSPTPAASEARVQLPPP